MTFNNKFAGFWKRFVAYVIDHIILGFIELVIFLPILFIMGIVFLDNNRFSNYRYSAINVPAEIEDLIENVDIFILVIVILMITIVSLVINWLYYALMESSGKQATPGKMILGLKVVDLEGNRISFIRATGRFFAKIISGLIFNIGFIIAAFTEKKQALHDIMAGCLIYDVTKTNFIDDYNKRDVI